MTDLGYTKALYILAFDHRGSFQKKMLGIAGDPTPEEAQRISDAKRVIFEGFVQAVSDGAPRESAGMLVDEQFGADIARSARSEGYLLAMPVEKSGQDEFDFEYGAAFGDHILAFDGKISKAGSVSDLVPLLPAEEATGQASPPPAPEQTRQPNHVADFLPLVPAEPAQLERVGGDNERYDNELRPGLMVDTLAQIQTAGIEPDIWKIEGIDTRADCERIAATARREGRDDVACVVLGRGADEAAVVHWLQQGACLAGYIGFAIGRTIWWDALKAYLNGDTERAAAAKAISENYRRMIDVYTRAEG